MLNDRFRYCDLFVLAKPDMTQSIWKQTGLVGPLFPWPYGTDEPRLIRSSTSRI